MTIRLKPLLAVAVALASSVTMSMAEDDTPLSKEMSTLNKSLRTLKRQVADPAKKADSLALIAKMKETVANGIKMEPAKTKDQPAADKPKYLEAYKAQMMDLDKALDTLKEAVDKGDAAAAQATFEKLSELKEKGHKDFAPDE